MLLLYFLGLLCLGIAAFVAYSLCGASRTDAGASTLSTNFFYIVRVLHVEWLVTGFANGVYWFMYKRHPIIQIAYIALIVGAYGTFVLHGYPYLPNLYMAGYHKLGGAIVFIGCLVTFAMASFSDPGCITEAHVTEYMRLYPYDGVMYPKMKLCKTCGIPKVARSKHCRVCDRCVSKFDHHCIWLNNCVAERTYRWFLSYLFLNSVLLMYGVAATLSVLASDVVEQKLFEAKFINRASGERVAATYAVVGQYLLYHRMPIVMVGLLCLVMGVVLCGFTIYHGVLAAGNMTTNETFKATDLQEQHHAAVEHYNSVKLRLPEGGRVGEDGSVHPPPSIVVCLRGDCTHPEHASNKDTNKNVKDWVLQKPPPVPPHSYDGGLRANLREAFWPPSLYGRWEVRKGAPRVFVPPISRSIAVEAAAAEAGKRKKSKKTS